MLSNNKILRDLFDAFPKGIINDTLSFVADPRRRVNSSIGLAYCESRNDVVCSLLENLAYEGCLSKHFESKSCNDAVHIYHRCGINKFCGTKFTEEDLEIIRNELGDGILHGLTLRFIESGFDMNVLEE